MERGTLSVLPEKMVTEVVSTFLSIGNNAAGNVHTQGFVQTGVSKFGFGVSSWVNTKRLT